MPTYAGVTKGLPLFLCPSFLRPQSDPLHDIYPVGRRIHACADSSGELSRPDRLIQPHVFTVRKIEAEADGQRNVPREIWPRGG
jgi:hypothetical protein